MASGGGTKRFWAVARSGELTASQMQDLLTDFDVDSAEACWGRFVCCALV